MPGPLAKLAGGQQIFDIAVAAYQNAFYKDHGEGGPTGPQFESVAFAPVAEITAVFQIMMLDIGIRKAFANGFAHGVLAHAHHDNAMLGDGCLNLFHHLSVMAGNDALNGGVDVGFIQNVSWHGEFSKSWDIGAKPDSDEMTRPRCSKDNAEMTYPTLDESIGNTPLVRLQRLSAELMAPKGNVILGKLEGNKPAGSVKDRPALSMIKRAEERGEIKPGDTLIEATSGNTGIALAMAAAIKGYRMVLIMPEDLSIERAQTMKAFGAELILTPKSGGMEYARDLAERMQAEGKGRMLDQFANEDNPRIHYETTGPELWEQTQGRITHFVSARGTTGTITGVSRFLKEKNSAIRIIGAQPSEGSRIPGIRKWPQEYLPKIYDASHVDELVYVSQDEAEEMCRRLAREEGIFAGISAAGACWVAMQIAQQVENATIAFIVCDRGDRYLSTGVFPA